MGSQRSARLRQHRSTMAERHWRQRAKGVLGLSQTFCGAPARLYHNFCEMFVLRNLPKNRVAVPKFSLFDFLVCFNGLFDWSEFRGISIGISVGIPIGIPTGISIGHFCR